MVPRYLEFAKEIPEESPLTKAIGTGLQTYGALQQLQEQRLKTQEEKMRIGALPGELQRKQETEEQAIQTGALNLQYLPKKLEMEQKTSEQKLEEGGLDLETKKAWYNVLPQEIKNTLTKEQLANSEASIGNAAKKMDLGTAKMTYKDNSIGMLNGITDPKLLVSQYQQTRKNWLAMGGDPNEMPDTQDPKIIKQLSDSSFTRTKAGMMTADFAQKAALIGVKEAIKNGVVQTTGDVGNANSPDMKKYLEQKGTKNADAEDAVNNLANVSQELNIKYNNLERTISRSKPLYGPTKGWLTTKVSGDAIQAMSEASDIVLDKAAAAAKAGGGRISQALLTLAQKAKADPQSMTNQDMVNLISEGRSFTNQSLARQDMMLYFHNNGVHDNTDISRATNAFLSTEPDLIDAAKGIRNPNAFKGYDAWLMKNPEYLPRSMQLKAAVAYPEIRANLRDKGIISPQQVSAFEQESGTKTPALTQMQSASTQPQKAQQQSVINTGLVSDHNQSQNNFGPRDIIHNILGIMTNPNVQIP